MMQILNIIASTLLTCVFLVESSTASPLGSENNEDNITESLEFIINHPLNKERPASYLLGQPLTEEEIILAIQPVLENSDESDLEQLIQLYKVTDGLMSLHADGHPLKDIWLIPGYQLLSLRDLVETLLIMKRTSTVWNHSWLPLFASRAGDFLVYDTKNGHIFELLTKESLLWDVAPNILTFLQDIARKFRDGAMHLNDNGHLEELSMASQMNEVYEEKILSTLHVSANTKNKLKLDIFVEEENVLVPNLVFNCANMPNVCQNIKNAVNNGKTRNLQRITDSKQIQKNRQAACGKAKCVSPNNSCDEYPFASTSQGGAGATIMCVPLSENNSQGGQLNGFYKKNFVGNNDWFYMQSP